MAEYDQNITFRMPEELKSVVEDIARQNDRSRSKVMVYLMWSGIRQYRATGALPTRQEIDDLKKAVAAQIEIDAPRETIPVITFDNEPATVKQKKQTQVNCPMLYRSAF